VGLGFLESPRHLPALGGVATDGLHFDNATALFSHGVDSAAEPELGAVGAPHQGLEFEDVTLVLEALKEELAVLAVNVQVVHRGPPEAVQIGESEHRDRRGVGLEDLAFGGGPDDRHRDVLKKAQVAALDLTNALLRLSMADRPGESVGKSVKVVK